MNFITINTKSRMKPPSCQSTLKQFLMTFRFVGKHNQRTSLYVHDMLTCCDSSTMSVSMCKCAFESTFIRVDGLLKTLMSKLHLVGTLIYSTVAAVLFI